MARSSSLGVTAFAACLLIGWLVPPLLAQTPPVAIPNSALAWDYDDADLAVGPVTLFLVCLDGQPTANCAQVPISVGVAGTVAGQKVYTWKLPPLLAGPHVVSVQACTAAAAACSNGASLKFTFQVITDPKNLRLSGG